MQTSPQHPSSTSRRAFIHNGSLVLLAGSLASTDCLAAVNEKTKPAIRLGLLTDMHYADKSPAGSRHYRDTLAKLDDAAEKFAEADPQHVIELGDFIDAADSVATEKQYLKRINRAFSELPGEKHYVLGNHCVHTLTKEEFLEGVERPRSHYSFDAGGFHFVILDACFRADGKPYGRKNFAWTDPNIPASQLAWLRDDLKNAQTKTIVFVHQRLDVANNHGIKNAPAVRKVLEQSGKVLAVFQGHSHKNDLKTINNIHYCVHRAMVEGAGIANSGFSMVDVFANNAIRVSGFRKQVNYDWK